MRQCEDRKAQSKFGKCEYCGADLVPIYFKEEEYEFCGSALVKTGRVRVAIDVLRCPDCLTDYCVDDSFDGLWRKE